MARIMLYWWGLRRQSHASNFIFSRSKDSDSPVGSNDWIDGLCPDIGLYGCRG